MPGSGPGKKANRTPGSASSYTLMKPEEAAARRAAFLAKSKARREAAAQKRRAEQEALEVRAAALAMAS